VRAVRERTPIAPRDTRRAPHPIGAGVAQLVHPFPRTRTTPHDRLVSVGYRLPRALRRSPVCLALYVVGADDASTPNPGRVIDETLALVYSQCLRLTGALAPGAFGPLPLAELRASPLGGDLRRLAAVAAGERDEPADEVLSAVEATLGLLFWPTAADDYTIPRAFWETALGRVLARAKLRALATQGLVEVGEAAARLGVTRPTVWRWLDDGVLDGVRDETTGWTLVPERAIARMERVAAEFGN
jgi:excisionase family DNA binding protein